MTIAQSRCNQHSGIVSFRDKERRSLCIISVNYNNARLLAECVVRSELALVGINHEFVLIDNASTDDSLQFLESRFENRDNVLVIKADANRGFGAGCNLGAEHANAEILWFLNSDAWLTDISGLREAIEYLARPDTGIVGTAARLASGTPCPQAGGELSFSYLFISSLRLGKLFRSLPAPLFQFLRRTRYIAPQTLRNYLDSFDHVRRESIYLSKSAGGASFLIRRATYLLLNGFDERFFLYDEDADLCARTINAHFKIYIAPKLVAMMFESATTSRLSWLRLKRIKKRSRVLLIEKHFVGLKRNILLLLTWITWPLL